MILVNLDGRQFEVARDALEARLQEVIATHTEKLSELNPFLRSAIKSTAEVFLIHLGHKVPKGVDKLEYLAAYVAHMGLNALENGLPLNLVAKEVTDKPSEGEPDSVEAATN